MKKETMSLQEFANQVKELADSINQPCQVAVEISFFHEKKVSEYSCWIRGYGTYKYKTPGIVLAKLKKAINPKQIKDVVI